MHRLFISDLHLSEDTPEIESAFSRLLENERDLESLVILGDFFEAWIGDDDDSDFVNRIRTLLAACSDRGCELMIARGNRDFMLGQQFARDTGATLLKTRQLLMSAASSLFSSTAIRFALTTRTISSSGVLSMIPHGKLT